MFSKSAFCQDETALHTCVNLYLRGRVGGWCPLSSSECEDDWEAAKKGLPSFFLSLATFFSSVDVSKSAFFSGTIRINLRERQRSISHREWVWWRCFFLYIWAKPSSFIDWDDCFCLVVNKNRKKALRGGLYTGLVTRDIFWILHLPKEKMMTKLSFRSSSLVQPWTSLMNIGLTLSGPAPEIWNWRREIRSTGKIHYRWEKLKWNCKKEIWN